MVSPLFRTKSAFLDARLNTSRDNELLQRFVRIHVDDGSEDGDQTKPPKLEKAPSLDEGQKPDNLKGILHKPPSGAATPTSKPPSAKTKRVRIKVSIKKKKTKKLKQEEIYTDRDRATAATMGSKDIKISLKLKRKRERSKNLSIPFEAEPGTFLILGSCEMKKGEIPAAMDFINKALELNPLEKNALVARSKCYILLGQPENGLKDAEAALAIDKGFIKAIFQKAESLYYLADFEHSLMYYHRGLRMRPDHEGFKLGVHKAQKAIENAIGTSLLNTSKPNTRNPTPKSSKPGTARDKGVTPETITHESASRFTTPVQNTPKQSNRSTPVVKRPPHKGSKLLRELAVDKEYLDNLLTNPNIKCKYKDSDDDIVEYIQEAVDFLNTRQEFWRQQLPSHLK